MDVIEKQITGWHNATTSIGCQNNQQLFTDKLIKHSNMKIKSLRFQILICIAILTVAISCTKPGGTGSTPPPPAPVEETITFTVDIDPGSSVYPALGASQDAKITLTSKLPTAGITVDVVVKKDLDNTTVSSSTYSSSLSPFTATISNLSSGVLCTATFTVTSKTTASNSVVKSFKLARK